MALSSIQEIIQDIKDGKMVILMDDENRENEGDLIMAASFVRPEDINFMITHARGLVCLTLTEARCKQLDLPLMSDNNNAKFSTNFTLSIEAAKGVTTGISAADRATTILAAVAKDASASDIVQPGHIFPIMAKKGGVLHRAGHTEAGCDLARLAGLEPAAVIVEVIKEDGHMARRADLEAFAKLHDLKIGTIADLIQYRMRHEKTVSLHSSKPISTEFGDFVLHRFSEYGCDHNHFALVKGDPSLGETVVRVHTFKPLCDLFGIHKGAQGFSSRKSLQALSRCSRGVFVWIDEDKPLDLAAQFDDLTQKSAPTKPCSTIGVGSQILRHLGVRDMVLLSEPTKFNALSGFGLNITKTISTHDIDAYLQQNN